MKKYELTFKDGNQEIIEANSIRVNVNNTEFYGHADNLFDELICVVPNDTIIFYIPDNNVCYSDSLLSEIYTITHMETFSGFKEWCKKNNIAVIKTQTHEN